MKTSTGYIDERGVYHRGEEKKLFHEKTMTHKAWDHEMQRKEFAKEILQPFVNGEANLEFFKAYPEEAKNYYTPDLIKKLERKV